MIRAPSIAASALVALLAAGCAGRPAPVLEAPPAAPAPSLAVTWVAESSEYRALALQAFHLATERVEEAAAGRQPGTWAVSIDADETLISNLVFQQELEAAGLVYDPALWRQWVARREASLMPGVAAFLTRVRELGGRIAVVSNRRVSQHADTAANLDLLGVPWDVLLLRPDDAPRSKEPRWEALAAGTADPALPPLEVVLWIGDNIEDFPGGSQELRPGDPLLGQVGERWVLLPNPMYGSWE